MKNLIFKSLYVILVLTINSAHSESINKIAFIASIKASCSINKEMYQKCFQISEDGCEKMLTELLPECSQNKHVFPVHQKDIPSLTECLNKKFEEKLVSNGVNLDAPCSK